MKRFKFNNQYLDELGFVVSEGSGEILAQEEYELIEVEGRNGSLLVNKGTYQDIEKTFIISAVDFIEDENIEDMIKNIKKIFFDITDFRLFYAFEKKYNIVKKVVFNEDIKTVFEEFGDFQITFLCEPFYYEIEDNVELIKSNIDEITTKVFTNDGDFDSSPIIEVYGTGDVEFILNGEIINIDNVSTKVTIDTKLLLCLDNNNNNSKLKDFQNDFPTLPRGSNTLSVYRTENISRIVITKRTIYR